MAAAVLLLDIATAQLLKLADADQQCEAIIDGPQCAPMRKRMASAKIIIGVINDNEDADEAGGGKHWSVVAMRRKAWVDGVFVLEHYDPSGDAELNCDAATQFASALAERLSELCDEAADRIELRRVAAPVQHDGAVCGLTSLCYAKSIVEAAVLQASVLSRITGRSSSSSSSNRSSGGGGSSSAASGGGGGSKGGVANLTWGEVEVLRRTAARVLAPAHLDEAERYAKELGSGGFTSRMCTSARHVVFDLYDEAGDSEGFDELKTDDALDQLAAGLGASKLGSVSKGIDGPLYDFLQAVGLANLGAPLGQSGLTLEMCVASNDNRTSFLQQLKESGVEKVSDRQAFANAISKALRAGWLKPPYRGPFTAAGRELRSAREAQPNAAAPKLPAHYAPPPSNSFRR